MKDEFSEDQDEDQLGETEYETLVGSIAIAWNRIEREMDELLFIYMREEVDVFSRVIAKVGNESKGDLLEFLSRKRERSKVVKEHISHFAALFSILCENRNILQHALPQFEPAGIYVEGILKLSRSGQAQRFSVTLNELETLKYDMTYTSGYGRFLRVAVYEEKSRDRQKKPKKNTQAGRPAIKWRKVLAEYEKPKLPPKIEPI